MDIFALLIPLAIVATIGALLFGIYALFRGGDFSRSWSNKAMRWRIIAQLIAVLVLLAALGVKQFLRG